MCAWQHRLNFARTESEAFLSHYDIAPSSLHVFTTTPYRLGAVRPPPHIAGVTKRVGREGSCLWQLRPGHLYLA